MLAIVLGVFVIAQRMHRSEGKEAAYEIARGLTFAALVVANLALILTNRSWTRTIFSMMREPNRALWWVVGGASAVLCLVLFVPWMQRLFHFSSPHPGDPAICLAAGACSIVWFEILKLRHRLRPKKSRGGGCS